MILHGDNMDKETRVTMDKERRDVIDKERRMSWIRRGGILWSRRGGMLWTRRGGITVEGVAGTVGMRGREIKKPGKGMCCSYVQEGFTWKENRKGHTWEDCAEECFGSNST